MGWGRWLLLGDIGQQMDLSEQRDEMDQLRRRLRTKEADAAAAADRIDEVQRDNDELKLYLAATLRLLTAKGLATPAEIEAMVIAVDREDGTEDQRFSGKLTPDGFDGSG